MERKEAIEIVKNHLPHSSFTILREALETLIPELKESDDERIRKEIISFIRHAYTTSNDDWNFHNRWLPWLEKQGEHKPADKPEPKFKVGDWVVQKNGELFINDSKFAQITKIDKDTERCWFDCGTWLNAEDISLWTIRDVKDGDVLVFDDIIMIFKNIKTVCTVNTYVLYCNGIVVDDWCDFGLDAHPATKEQRDFLLQKMKETGYEWDADKKELRKIEQKSAWSEKDEKNVRKHYRYN